MCRRFCCGVPLMTKYLFSIFFLFFVGCATPKVLILQAPVASMQRTSSNNVKNLREGRPVEERWCNSDAPIRKNNDGSDHYGMIDQVLWKAHDRTRASFFVNCRFYQQNSCVYMSANIGSMNIGQNLQPHYSTPHKNTKLKFRK